MRGTDLMLKFGDNMMLKSIYSMMVVGAIFLSQLAFAPVAEARRCDEKPPETLLSLYRKSSEIHIARYEGALEVGILESGEDFTVTELKKRYTITSSLKGSTRAVFEMEDSEYRYTGEEEQPEYDGMHPMFKLSPGETVLLFLKRGETPGSVELADYADAVKPMSGKKLDSYEKSIGELNSLFASGEPSESRLVEWIIRTIENPHTRWEGAFELLSGFETLEWKEEWARNIRERQERGETIEEWELDGSHFEEYERFDNTPYARLLDDRQKQRLLEIVLSAFRSGDINEKDASIAEGGRVLIDLVGRWGDDRLAEMLIEKIAAEAEHGWTRAKYMDRVAKILGDEEARAIVSRYEVVYYMDDEDEVENEGPVTVVTRSDTYGKLKTELVEKFTDRCRNVLATKNAEPSS